MTAMGIEAELKALFEAHWGPNSPVQQRLKAVEEYLARTTPTPIPQLAGSAVGDANGNAVIQLGPVPQGRTWHIGNLSTGPQYDQATVSGLTATIVVSNVAPVPGQVPVVSIRGKLTALPGGQTYSRGQLYAIGPASIWVVITGGTTGTSYVASALGYQL